MDSGVLRTNRVSGSTTSGIMIPEMMAPCRQPS